MKLNIVIPNKKSIGLNIFTWEKKKQNKNIAHTHVSVDAI